MTPVRGATLAGDEEASAGGGFAVVEGKPVDGMDDAGDTGEVRGKASFVLPINADLLFGCGAYRSAIPSS